MSGAKRRVPRRDAHNRLTETRVVQFVQERLGDRAAGRNIEAASPLRYLGLTPADLTAIVDALSEEVGEDVGEWQPDRVSTIHDLVELANDDNVDTEIVVAAPRRRTPMRTAPKQAPPPVRTAPGSGPQPRTKTAARGRQSGKGTTAAAIKSKRQGAMMVPVLREPPGEVDASKARFRTQRAATGKCVGSELEAITYAYHLAFWVCATAKNELAWLAAREDKQAELWNASYTHHEAALGYWFGHSIADENDLSWTIRQMRIVVGAWTECFDVGFRGNLPVFIRCKDIDPVAGNPGARHLARNTIEVMPSFFQKPSREERGITLLHEMGHWAIKATEPRDERDSLCSGGWNAKKDMCYRDRGGIHNERSIFRSGNPRMLAIAYDSGTVRAKKVALNNIDSYVCWMWNRLVDRGDWVLDTTEAGSTTGKPAQPPPSKGKPIN